MKLVIPIDEVDPARVDRFGGKAASLARLRARGLPVPEAVVLPAEAFTRFLRHNDLSGRARRVLSRGLAGPAADLRRAVLAGRLPPSLAGALRAGTGSLGRRLVVRSSAAGEDGGERSFAGQHLTVVNVAPGDEVERALKRCWASLFSTRSLAYRRGGRPPSPAMAVVIQVMVDARVAGVLFTINPVTGSWREMTLEAAFGQGEALVSGQVSPDRYRLRRPRRLPRPLHRVLARLTVAELEADVVPQPRQLVAGAPGQLRWRPVSAPGSRALTPAQALRIGRLGLRVEALAGEAQDIEWALDHDGAVHLLQARPITAAGEPERGGEVLWTRRFIGERFVGLASPLGWSVVGTALERFIDYPRTSSRLLGGAPATRLLRGRPYLNVSVFRHLAFKLPGLPPPGFMMDFLPPEEVDRWTRRFAYPPDHRIYRSILEETWAERRWRRFRWNPLTNPRAWDRFVEELEVSLPRLEVSAGDPEGALKVARRCLEMLERYIGVHVISLLMANLLYQGLAGSLPPELREDLLRCPGVNKTVETNRALWQLARGGSMEGFLERYGHRCSGSSWELFTPRWVEQPELLEPLLESIRRSDAPDPLVQARRQAAATEAATEALAQRAGPLTMRALSLAQRYLQLREDQRFWFDKLLLALKRALLVVGERALGQAELTRFLQWEELVSVHEGRLARQEAVALAQRRCRQWARYAEEEPPPVFLLGDEGVEVEAGAGELRGLGISAGRATGTVRVLRSSAEGRRLQPGEILVATATDPGWTPLFLVAGAVVLELGSMLSHGAVVAREYGLPAVVNVPGATERLADGQRVTVDGGRGLVRIEDEGPV